MYSLTLISPYSAPAGAGLQSPDRLNPPSHLLGVKGILCLRFAQNLFLTTPSGV